MLSVLSTGRALLPRNIIFLFLILISVTDWVNLSAIARLEEVGKLKKFSGLIGNRTFDFTACSTVSQPTVLPTAYLPTNTFTLFNCYCKLSYINDENKEHLLSDFRDSIHNPRDANKTATDARPILLIALPFILFSKHEHGTALTQICVPHVFLSWRIEIQMHSHNLNGAFSVPH
jgi:hypothetical protein